LLLGHGAYSPAQYVPTPLNVASWLLALFPGIFALVIWRKKVIERVRA